MTRKNSKEEQSNEGKDLRLGNADEEGAYNSNNSINKDDNNNSFI